MRRKIAITDVRRATRTPVAVHQREQIARRRGRLLGGGGDTVEEELHHDSQSPEARTVEQPVVLARWRFR